ncbi:MAG: 30S ribosomal protein S8 [Abditibacteriales bacterium]|nr:30S ribosomal protein S8 [Abditibacteriales bacterium]MDW8364994.1 30S ribosomal protein S8 [Abditibacteriales bacterium]
MQTDPIADFLTRIRNANAAGHDEVRIPSSRLKVEIAKILQSEGYIRGYQLIDDKKQGILRVLLKYGEGHERVINGLRRVSKPGRRIYVGKDDIPRVLGGLGIAILSTPRGIVTDRRARRLGVGGEVLCEVW